MYVCMYVCMYVYIYICIYTHVYLSKGEDAEDGGADGGEDARPSLCRSLWFAFVFRLLRVLCLLMSVVCGMLFVVVCFEPAPLSYGQFS